MSQPLDNFIEKLASSLLFLDPKDQELYLSAVRSTIETADHRDYMDKSAEDLLLEAATVVDLYKKSNIKRSK
jgi:hypothetical protein